jgi:hypothetical protein
MLRAIEGILTISNPVNVELLRAMLVPMFTNVFHFEMTALALVGLSGDPCMPGAEYQYFDEKETSLVRRKYEIQLAPAQ